MMKFLKKHWEVLSYLIFGVLTTLLNILLYALFNRLFGYTAANSPVAGKTAAGLFLLREKPSQSRPAPRQLSRRASF